MVKKTMIIAIATLFSAIAVVPISAQNNDADPLVASVRDSGTYVRYMYTKVADAMSDEDYAFRPTPEVRSFGDILAHVADTNYWFCSTAIGEKPPKGGIEKAKLSRSGIKKALSESFDYCEGAYQAMGDPTKARAMVDLMGSERPALAVLIFRTHHSLLHYGNVVTYMRLRGKVPPSSLPEGDE